MTALLIWTRISLNHQNVRAKWVLFSSSNSKMERDILALHNFFQLKFRIFVSISSWFHANILIWLQRRAFWNKVCQKQVFDACEKGAFLWLCGFFFRKMPKLYWDVSKLLVILFQLVNFSNIFCRLDFVKVKLFLLNKCFFQPSSELNKI